MLKLNWDVISQQPRKSVQTSWRAYFHVNDTFIMITDTIFKQSVIRCLVQIQIKKQVIYLLFHHFVLMYYKYV